MLLISHRGNIEGPCPDTENIPKQILLATKRGFNVEVDVWYIGGNFYLGHDGPKYLISESFFLGLPLWLHAKNIEALNILKDKYHCFFHNTDDAVLTSRGFIWVYPGKKLISGCVAVLPEGCGYAPQDLKLCYALCTDNPIYWLERLS